MRFQECVRMPVDHLDRARYMATHWCVRGTPGSSIAAQARVISMQLVSKRMPFRWLMAVFGWT